jgi:hypothetical protein
MARNQVQGCLAALLMCAGVMLTDRAGEGMTVGELSRYAGGTPNCRKSVETPDGCQDCVNDLLGHSRKCSINEMGQNCVSYHGAGMPNCTHVTLDCGGQLLDYSLAECQGDETPVGPCPRVYVSTSMAGSAAAYYCP